MCRRIGGLWHHCRPDKVTVEGDGAAGYVQGDCVADHLALPGVRLHHPLVAASIPAYPRMGVNLRMFDPALWRDLPRRFIDGASY